MASAVRSTRFGGDLQASQNSHLFATVIEGGLLARPRLHTPHSGREGRVLDIQFSISGELASVTARAHKVGTRHLHLAQGGEDRLGAHLPIVSLFSARARKAPLIGGGYRELQQFAERRRSGPMQGRAHRHLHGVQIQTPRLAALLENNRPGVGLLRAPLPGGSFPPVFFLAREDGSSTGRKRQIASLTSRSRRPSSRKQ